MLIQRAQLEGAINRCRAADGRDGVEQEGRALSPDLERMAEVYGRMILDRSREIETEKLDAETARAIVAWVDA